MWTSFCPLAGKKHIYSLIYQNADAKKTYDVCIYHIHHTHIFIIWIYHIYICIIMTQTARKNTKAVLITPMAVFLFTPHLFAIPVKLCAFNPKNVWTGHHFVCIYLKIVCALHHNTNTFSSKNKRKECNFFRNECKYFWGAVQRFLPAVCKCVWRLWLWHAGAISFCQPWANFS